jgi:hypothetical protein
VYSLSYPACIAHAPYCHLWPAPLLSIFPHYLINDTILEKKPLNTKCVFWYPTQRLSETFLTIRRTERDVIKKGTLVLMWSTRFSCPILMKVEFSGQIFEEHSNIKFHENPSSGSRVVPCGRKDRHGEANRRFPQFYERACYFGIISYIHSFSSLSYDRSKASSKSSSPHSAI